ADAERGCDDGRLIDAVSFREFVGELIDDRVRNADAVSLCGMNVDCLTIVAKDQNGIDLLAFEIWHLDIAEGGFFRSAEGTKKSDSQEERTRPSRHSFSSITNEVDCA